MSPVPAPRPPRDDVDRLLTIPQFCAWVQIGQRTFRQWCTDGTAPRRVRIGGQIRIRQSDVDAWLDTRYVS